MISLVTGVGGFVGPYLADHLVSKNHQVFGIERRAKKVSGCEVFPCDILNSENVDEIFKKTKPDFVFHLAAISSVTEGNKDPLLTSKVNIDGARNVLNAALKYAPSASVLIVSTAHVYGVPKKIPLTEDHPLNPISEYGKTRLEQEKLAGIFFRKHNLKVVIARSFNHTGPSQPPGFICSDFAKQISEVERGAKSVIHAGDLSSERDFTDVRDVVRAYLLLLEKGMIGEVYNVCSGNSYSGKEVLNKLLELSKVRIEVIEDKASKKGDIPVLVGDNSKIVAATGWRPHVPFEKTLSDVLEYWRKQ